MKEAEAKAMVNNLFGAYPLLRVSDATVEVYKQAFSAMTVERALLIINRLHVTHKDRPPNLGQVIEACSVQDTGARITGEEAYAQLIRAAQRYGRCYGDNDPPPKFDPLITKALGVWGSWNKFCDSPDDDAAGRARFITLYDQLAQREQIAKVVPTPPDRQLVGAPERRQVGERPRAALAVVHSIPEARTNTRPTAKELEAFERKQGER
jgi:hypothetical protein